MKYILIKFFLVLTLLLSSTVTYGINVVDATQVMYNEQPAVAIIFDAPVNSKERYDSYITVTSNKDGKTLQIKGILDKELQIIYYAMLNNNEEYSISVKKGLKGLNGDKTTKDFSKTVKTDRLSRGARFASSGMVVIPYDKAVLPVTAINIESMIVNFYKTDVDSYPNWFGKKTSEMAYSETVNTIAKSSSMGGLKRYEYKDFSNDYFSYTIDYEPVYSKAYNVDSVNKQTTLNIELPKEFFDHPGVYYAVIQSPDNYHKLATTTFIISDIGMQIRKYDEAGSYGIWTRSLKDGKPMPGVEISATILEKNNTYTESLGTTDSNGFLSINNIDNEDKILTVKGVKDKHLAILNMARPVDLSDFDISGIIHSPLKIFVYGPRDLYRGGETVKYNILVRRFDGSPANAPFMDIKLRNPKGTVVNTAKVDTKQYYQYSYALEPGVPTGRWQVEVSALNGEPVIYSFSVEDFMPEKLKLTLGTPGETLIANKNTASRLKVQGDYLYGAPAASNNIDGFFNIKTDVTLGGDWSGYYFGDKRVKDVTNKNLRTKRLDSNGKGEFDISSETLLSAKNPVKIEYYITLYEEGGRSVSRAKEYVYMPSGEAVGIKPLFKDYAPTNTKTQFDIINISERGKPVGGKFLVTLNKEERNYYWEYSNTTGWKSNYSSIKYPVKQETVTLGDTPLTMSYDTSWGYYELIVENLSTGQVTYYAFRAGSWRYDNNSSPNTKPETLSLTLDKPGYKSGDKAKLKIVSAYKGTGQVTVESGDGVLWHSNITLIKGDNYVEIPVYKTWNRNDIYVSAYIARNESEMEKTQKSIIFGMLHLPLDRSDRIIDLDISHAAKVEPDKDFEIVIKAKDLKYAGKAYVTLAVVDQGILSLKRFDTPDATKLFFGKERYTGVMYDNFWQVIHKYSSKMAARYGGDADMIATKTIAKGGALARADINIVSVFKEPIILDSKGEARIKLNISSFNGEVRIMALAFTDDSYGSSESAMKIAEPVITELSLPRFIATNDSTELTLEATNMTDTDQTVNLNVTATYPLSIPDGLKTSVLLKKGEKTVFKIPTTATGVYGYGEIDVKISGTAGDKTKKWRLAVRSPYPAVTKSKLTKVEPGSRAAVFNENINKYILDPAELSLNIQTILPLAFNMYFRNLLQYPYGCLEQTTSSAFPLLYANEKIIKLYNLWTPKETTIDDLVNVGIERLAAKQRSDGSFGYWDANSGESRWGSVYATDFLNTAVNKGYKVNEQLIRSANNKLMAYVRNNLPSSGNYYESSSYYNKATKAYAAYVLSKGAKIGLSDVVSVYNELTLISLPETYIPMLHIAIALKNTGDYGRAEKAFNDAVTIYAKPKYGYYGDYGSELRDTAWFLQLIKEYDKTNTEFDSLLEQLSEMASRRSWLSTQERLRLFALVSIMADSGDVTGILNYNGQTQTISESGRFIKILSGSELISPVEFKSEAKMPLYVYTDFIAYTKQAPEPYKQNADIAKLYYDLWGKPLDISTVKTGEYVFVEIRYSTLKTTADGLIVDFLPAGFELENQNLDNSMKLSSAKWLQGRTRANIIYNEYRDDRFVAAVRTYSDNRNSVWYIMKAVTPGTYSNPPAYFEDMYRPDMRALGETNPPVIKIIPN